MQLLPLPESLIIDIRKIFAWARLQATMLDLDHLRALIEEGQEGAICQDWLHGTEQEKLSTLHYPKRHLEWLGGRICAKQAARQYLLHGSQGNPSAPAAMRAPHLQITSAPSGRPLLDPGTLPGDPGTPHISISHSKRYALAVAASTPCGIDIQAASDALGRVHDRFCSTEEEALLGRHLQKLQPSDHLTLLWAAKEAVKKATDFDRMPGFLDLALTDIQTIAETDSPANCLFTLDYQDRHQESCTPQLQLQVTVCLFQGYGIGLCVIPSQPCPGVNHA
jgi:4'-phosphopantetheinyl transferase EntD